MADGDRQLAFTTGPVPTSVQVSGPDRLTPKSVNASFDGTGAAGDFLPCLIIVGRTGLEVARIPAPKVAAGASAEVSWFPHVSGATDEPDEIAFDKDNEGGWLYVRTNDTQDSLGPIGEVGSLIDDQTGVGNYLVSSRQNSPPISYVGVIQDEAHLVAANFTADAARIDMAGGFMDFSMGFPSVLVMRFNGGDVFITLPTVPGASGSLYNAGGFVKVAP